MTWNKHVEKEGMDIECSKEDLHCLSKWIVDVNQMATRLR